MKNTFSKEANFYKNEFGIFWVFPLMNIIKVLAQNVSTEHGTHVDGSIGLDVVHVGVGQTQLLAASLHWTDNARSYGVPESKRAPHRNHKLSLANVRRAAERQRG